MPEYKVGDILLDKSTSTEEWKVDDMHQKTAGEGWWGIDKYPYLQVVYVPPQASSGFVVVKVLGKIDETGHGYYRKLRAWLRCWRETDIMSGYEDERIIVSDIERVEKITEPTLIAKLKTKGWLTEDIKDDIL